jgi:pumilio family protein 6
VGARVVELLFSNFSPKATAPLKQEFYGPHFSLFADETNAHPTLASNLELTPEKKDVTLEFVVSMLNKAMEKGLFGFVYLQELFCEYVSVAPPEDIRSMSPNVVDHSIHMLSTRAGTRVVAACASYGTTKDRKRILKSLKGYTRSSLLHRDAYLAILQLVQVTDDTVSVHKSILAEVLTDPKEAESPLLEIALHETGSRLFLMLLVSSEEERQKYFDPYERQVLDANPTVLEDGERVPTSKKNPETRRKELMNYVRKPLIEMCSLHADVLIRSLPGSRVLREVYSAFRPQEVVDAVVAVCFAELSTSNDDGESLSLFEDPVGHLAVKNLLSCDADDKALFATAFYDKMQSRLMEVGSSNRGAFVLTALLKVEATREKTLKELSSHMKELHKLAKEGRATAGFTALLQEMAGKGKV